MNEEKKQKGKIGREANPRIYQFDYLIHSSFCKALRKAIENLKKDNIRILDIGCGTKPYISFFEDKTKEYIGIDSINGKYVDYVASAEKLPFPSKSFDVVISTQVLEHVKDPVKVIKEIYRVLKKEGVVFLSTHGVWELHGRPNDYWRWTDEGLKILFGNFKNVKVINNGGSILCLFQLLNIYINKIPNIFIPIKIPLFLINNLIGKYFDNPKYTNLVINYLVIAKK